MSTVVLGVRLISNQFQRIKLDNVDLESKVYMLKDEAAKQTNTQKTSIELVYCGVILNDESSLSSCGIKPGVMVHVLQKILAPEPPPKRSLTEAEIQQLVVAFQAFTLSAGYRTALQRLSRPEVLDNIIAATPGLAEDPVAIAMIRDPELIVHLSDVDTVRKTAKLHPSLIEAANQIVAHVHEEAATVNQNQPGTSSGYSYSLEALSDDEDMDSSDSNNREGNPLARNASYSAITAAQLASAIANATNINFTSSGAPANATNAGSNIITNEMFSNAMQQAFAGSTSSAVAPPAPTSQPTPARQESESVEAVRMRLQPQLRQMNEMGLLNDSVNMRALQATSGDVQAAIELVFNGVID